MAQRHIESQGAAHFAENELSAQYLVMTLDFGAQIDKLTDAMNEPLTAEELAALRKRVAYLVDSARDARESWIDADIWQRTLATIDTLNDERESAQRSSRRFFALSNVLLEEIDRINSCPRCERYADGYGDECERSGDSLEECSHEECSESGCEIVSFSPERINRARAVAHDESKDATDAREAGRE